MEFTEKDYIATYVCRMCGKKIQGAMTANKSIIEEEMMMYRITGEFESPFLHKHESHYCENGNYGIGDFVGFTRGDNYNEGEFIR